MLLKKKIFVGCFIFVCLLWPMNVYAATYKADQAHSNLTFKVKESAGYIVGLFSNFGVIMELSEDNVNVTSLKAIVDVTSVYTRNHQRDIDLLGAELFNAVKFPKAKFISKKIEGNKMIGDLTMKGKTKEEVFDYTLGKTAQDKWGRTIIDLTAKATISRKDFGILYNRKLDDGSSLIDDNVELDINIQGVLQK